MAKKKNDDGFGLLIIAAVFAASLVAGLIFLVNTFLVRNHFAKKYDLKNVPVRVTESTWIIIKGFVGLTVGIGFFGGLGFYLIFAGFHMLLYPQQLTPIQAALVFVIMLVLGILFVLLALACSARLGVMQIGMLIFPEKGFFVIPADTHRNTFSENILHGRWFLDMFKMEELPLKQITKITREKGKIVYVHGKFGTRKIAWGDKQKRDECINALEMACKRRLTGMTLED